MIGVTYTSIDWVRKSKTFKTLKGAQKFAQYWVGETPDLGAFYAVSFDGVGKITCAGCAVADLFPKLKAEAAIEAEQAEVMAACDQFGVPKAWGIEP